MTKLYETSLGAAVTLIFGFVTWAVIFLVSGPFEYQQKVSGIREELAQAKAISQSEARFDSIVSSLWRSNIRNHHQLCASVEYIAASWRARKLDRVWADNTLAFCASTATKASIDRGRLAGFHFDGDMNYKNIQVALVKETDTVLALTQEIISLISQWKQDQSVGREKKVARLQQLFVNYNDCIGAYISAREQQRDSSFVSLERVKHLEENLQRLHTENEIKTFSVWISVVVAIVCLIVIGCSLWKKRRGKIS